MISCERGRKWKRKRKWNRKWNRKCRSAAVSLGGIDFALSSWPAETSVLQPEGRRGSSAALLARDTLWLRAGVSGQLSGAHRPPVHNIRAGYCAPILCRASSAAGNATRLDGRAASSCAGSGLDEGAIEGRPVGSSLGGASVGWRLLGEGACELGQLSEECPGGGSVATKAN